MVTPLAQRRVFSLSNRLQGRALRAEAKIKSGGAAEQRAFREHTTILSGTNKSPLEAEDLTWPYPSEFASVHCTGQRLEAASSQTADHSCPVQKFARTSHNSLSSRFRDNNIHIRWHIIVTPVTLQTNAPVMPEHKRSKFKLNCRGVTVQYVTLSRTTRPSTLRNTNSRLRLQHLRRDPCCWQYCMSAHKTVSGDARSITNAKQYKTSKCSLFVSLYHARRDRGIIIVINSIAITRSLPFLIFFSGSTRVVCVFICMIALLQLCRRRHEGAVWQDPLESIGHRFRWLADSWVAFWPLSVVHWSKTGSRSVLRPKWGDWW